MAQDGLYALDAVYSTKLVVLSWAVSLLGSWSTAVVMAQAGSTRSRAARLAWILAASICFGFGSIWSMHFVGMLAANLGVSVTFEPWLTVLSAILAVAFSFIALATVSCVDYDPKRRRHNRSGSKSDGKRPGLKRFSALFNKRESRRPSLAVSDHEGGGDESRQPLLPKWNASSRRSSVATVATEGDPREDFFAAGAEVAANREEGERSKPSSNNSIAPFASAITPPPVPMPNPDSQTLHETLQVPTPPILKIPTPPAAPATYSPTDSNIMRSPSRRHSSQTITSSTSESSDSMMDGSSEATASSSTSISWLDHLLSPAARARIKGGDGHKTESHLDYLVRRIRAGFAPVYLASALVYTGAICGMHYVGMSALRIEGEGELVIRWSVGWIVVSCLVAFIDCFVSCIILAEIEPSMGRQGGFAFVAATGVCLMHYTGMRAASFYSTVPSDHQAASFPIELLAAVVIAAITASFLSNVILAYMATLSRNRLAENVLIKRRAWRLLAQKEAAEQANALKSDFISTASHELRTPLHTVSGYTDLLMRTPLSEEQRLYLESIRRACATLNLMTRSVLDFSKLERGGEEHAMLEFVNLRECIENVAHLCEERQSALNIREHATGDVQLLVDVDATSPHAIFTDEVFLSRIATNLLSNALKFCKVPGYVSLHVSYADQTLSIVVSDSGIGINAKYLPLLFQPFTQADSSLTRRHAGTGLGLAISRQLVERLKGTITVESREGVGTTFIVKLPIEHVQPPPPSTGQELAPSGSPQRLAVACLDPATSGAVSEIWRRRGWEVREVDVEEDVGAFDGATRIWADASILEKRPELVTRLAEATPETMVPLFVPLSEEQSLPGRGSSFIGPNVVNIRMPLIAHRIAPQLREPEPFLVRNVRNTDRPKLVRFASSTASSSGNEDANETDATSLSHFDSPLEPSPMPATLPMLKSMPPAAAYSPLPSTASPRVGSPALTGVNKQDSDANHPVILLAEDNPVNAKLGQRVLQVLKYKPLLAVNGQEAVDICRSRNDIAAILMDCHMPVLDGIQATKRIREMEASGELQGRRPVIALTANVSSESQAQCRDAGLDDFMSKPLRLNDLERALERHLHLSRCTPPPSS